MTDKTASPEFISLEEAAKMKEGTRITFVPIVLSHLPLLQVRARLILQLEMLLSAVEHSVISQDLVQLILQPLHRLHRVQQLSMLLVVPLQMLQQV